MEGRIRYRLYNWYVLPVRFGLDSMLLKWDCPIVINLQMVEGSLTNDSQ